MQQEITADNPKIQKKKKKTDWKEIGFLISVGIVPIINFAVFYIYMNFDSFLLAFQTTTGKTTVWGFENFKTVISLFGEDKNGELLLALKNTGIWCLLNIFMLIPPMLTTYFIYRKMPGNKFVTFASVFPGLLPAAAYSNIVKYYLIANGRISLYGYATMLGGGNPIPFFELTEYANKTMIWLTVWGGVGINLLWSGAMHGISPEILEAGEIDGTNWFKELTLIVIPLMWPTLSVTLMGLVAGILGSSGPLILYTQGLHGTMTLSYWIFDKVNTATKGGAVTDINSNAAYELPSALGLLMSCISIPLVFLVRHFAEKVEVY